MERPNIHTSADILGKSDAMSRINKLERIEKTLDSMAKK